MKPSAGQAKTFASPKSAASIIFYPPIRVKNGEKNVYLFRPFRALGDGHPPTQKTLVSVEKQTSSKSKDITFFLKPEAQSEVTNERMSIMMMRWRCYDVKASLRVFTDRKLIPLKIIIITI
jgi:hypothetical protein